MGKLIEWYVPVPKAVLTLASEVEAEPAEAPATPAADILKKCLEHVDTMENVLVMTMDKEGVLAFLTNCDGLAESILMMEMVKQQAIFGSVEGPGGIA
jgi:hypothetical protein